MDARAGLRSLASLPPHRHRFPPSPFFSPKKLHLEPSIEVKGHWKNLVNIEFEKLGTVTMEPSATKDLLSCGEVMLYNRALDNVEPRNEMYVAAAAAITPLCPSCRPAAARRRELLSR